MRRSCIVAGAILILMTISNLALPNKVYACLCGPDDYPIEEASAKADTIFTGKVIGITESTDVLPGGFTFWNVTFEVTTIWKGASQAQFIVKDYMTDCGFEFQNGSNYLVYASGDDGAPLSTNKCTRTKLLSVAAADIAALGQGRSINQAGQGRNMVQPSPLGDLAAPGLGFLILLVSAVLLIIIFRHRSRSTPT